MSRPIHRSPAPRRRGGPLGFLQPEAWIMLALIVLVALVVMFLVFSPRRGPGSGDQAARGQSSLLRA